MRTNKKYLPSTTRRTKQLENVIKQFDNWRASRKKRGRIPEHLWDAAVSLCNDNSISQITQILRLNYSDFKKKVLAAQDGGIPSNNNRKRGRIRDSISFMDVSLPTKNIPSIKSSGTATLIDLYHVNGVSMRIVLPQIDGAAISEILSSFLSSV